MMKIKLLYILLFLIVSFIVFSCNNQSIKEYKKTEILESEISEHDTIQRIRIPTH